jgi:hypothetical protein
MEKDGRIALDSRLAQKRAKPLGPTNPFLEFDLSGTPLKENHADLPVWVGDLREKYYKKSTGGGGDQKNAEFEYVVRVLRSGPECLLGELLSEV